MYSWVRFALALAGTVVAVSSASAWHHYNTSYFPVAPGAAPSAASYAVPTYSYAAPAYSYGAPASSYAVAPAYGYSVGVQSYAYSAPAASYAVPMSVGASSVDAQAFNFMLLQNLLGGLLNNRLGPSSGDLSDLDNRVSDLESRVDALEKGRKTSGKKTKSGSKGRYKTGAPDAVSEAVSQDASDDPVQTALDALQDAQDAADNAQLKASQALRVLKRQQESTADSIKRLEQVLAPQAGQPMPHAAGRHD